MKIHEGKCTEKILKERERIGSRLAILRKKRNMTQEELANLCGVNRVNIAKIEKGAYNVSIDILSKVTNTHTIQFINMVTLFKREFMS